jgi:hypothetical protein
MSSETNHNCVDIKELLETTKINIEKFGLQVIMVKPTSYCPSFAYSIGLWQKFKHPEIICFALPEDLGHAIINDVTEIIKGGENVSAGKAYSNIFKDSRAEFLNVDPNNIDDYFGVAIDYYNSNDFPALQLVWTDRNDKFPWEENFEEEFIYKQPLLDRNADFKFREPKNLATFTTRQWLELNGPILRVVHDSDGDWQFLTGDQMPEDIRIVALHELIDRDKTLNEIFDLDYGEDAERDFVGGKWTRNKMEYDGEE